MPPKKTSSSPSSSLSSDLGNQSSNALPSLPFDSNNRSSSSDSEHSEDHASSSSSSNNLENSTEFLLNLLSRISPPKGIDVRTPDTFKGDDPSKLRPFLAQCRMMFRANPKKFPDQQSQVLYAASYLEAVAQAWFEPYLFAQEEETPEFLTSFSKFEEELTTLFGDPDAVATAEYKINKLHMKENHQVSKYITLFRQYQTQIDWDEKALIFRFRQGLAERILDELAIKEEKPVTLLALQKAALKIDQRYWERQKEKRDANLLFKERKGHESTNKRPFIVQKTFNDPAPKNPSSPFNSYSPSSVSSSSNNAKGINHSHSHIGADRKLTAAERERRRKNGLCLYCGEAGHLAESCPKRKPPSAAAAKPNYSSALKAVEVEKEMLSMDSSASSPISANPHPKPGVIKTTFTIIDADEGKEEAI